MTVYQEIYYHFIKSWIKKRKLKTLTLVALIFGLMYVGCGSDDDGGNSEITSLDIEKAFQEIDFKELINS